MKTLLSKSPLMIFLRPIAISESTTWKFVYTFAPVTVFDVFISAIDFADSVSLIHTNASIGRPAQEDPPLLKFIRQILKLLKPGQASNSSCPASFFWEVVSLSPYSAAGPFQTFKGIFCLLSPNGPWAFIVPRGFNFMKIHNCSPPRSLNCIPKKICLPPHRLSLPL